MPKAGFGVLHGELKQRVLSCPYYTKYHDLQDYKKEVHGELLKMFSSDLSFIRPELYEERLRKVLYG